MFKDIIVVNGIIQGLDKRMQEVHSTRVMVQANILFCSQLAKSFRNIKALTYNFIWLLIDIQILSYKNYKELKYHLQLSVRVAFIFVSSSWKYFTSDKKVHQRSIASEWIQAI